MTTDSHRDRLISRLNEGGIEFTAPEGEPYVAVTIPGTARLKTHVLITPSPAAIRFEAFICRAVEEHREEVYAYLLHHNRRSFGVAYTIDTLGDIYLVGHLPADASVEAIDQVLGQIAERSDNDFNRILELGFETSIRKEWAWRLSRGESTRNLAAFEHLRPMEEEQPSPDAAA